MPSQREVADTAHDGLSSQLQPARQSLIRYALVVVNAVHKRVKLLPYSSSFLCATALTVTEETLSGTSCTSQTCLCRPSTRVASVLIWRRRMIPCQTRNGFSQPSFVKCRERKCIKQRSHSLSNQDSAPSFRRANTLFPARTSTR